MADAPFQLDVGDDSPEISYFPFVNLEPSTNVTDGWQLLYTGSGVATSPGQVGLGTSYHYTSQDGASFLISWNGTGIDLMGNVSNALYSITLDGILNTSYSRDPANTILASFNDLNDTNHSLLLTTIITNTSSPDAFLTLDKARITYTPPAGFVNNNVAFARQVINDSDIAFMGLWNYETDLTGTSLHVSYTAGDRAQTMFLGSEITIYGLTSSYSGSFTVTLDNVTTSLSAQSSYNNSDTLLFYATELPQDTPHKLIMTNLENRTLALRVGGINVTSFGNGTINSTSSSKSSSDMAGTIAAIVLAVVLFVVLCGISYYVWLRRKARAIRQHNRSLDMNRRDGEKVGPDVERTIDISPPPGEEELETATLSTSKGYGFGLGLRRSFPFTYRKGKGSGSSGRSRRASGPRVESLPMTPQYDTDEKRFSVNTLTEDLPVFHRAPESEKLAPGWSNPVARMSPSFRHSSRCMEKNGVSLPGLHRESIESVENNCDDDADVKTLTSRQNEALAATLSLSPRTSEAPASCDARPETLDVPRPSSQYLRVRDTSPFRVDVSAILGPSKSARASRGTCGSSGSTWSKVRARLYRKAHRDDGRQSYPPDGHEASSSSGPESVPVVMLESESIHPPSETAPASGTFSFLDFTSSHPSLRRHSKSTTVSSTPAEAGHGTGETQAYSENTSIKMVRMERSRDNLGPKPDAPSTASGGSHTTTPTDSSGDHTHPDAPTTQTHGSSPFLFPITISPSTHLPHPYNYTPERQPSPPLPPPPPPTANQALLHVPPTSPRTITEANSPTESIPFSVSDIHFRHSFSDYAGIDSRRASVASALPPHPPLPHRDSTLFSTPTYSPPPYVVQRVLGLPMTPLSPVSPPVMPDSPGSTASASRRPGTSPSRVGSLLGPRPRPSTTEPIRGEATPQLPMRGGRSNLRIQR